METAEEENFDRRKTKDKTSTGDFDRDGALAIYLSLFLVQQDRLRACKSLENIQGGLQNSWCHFRLKQDGYCVNSIDGEGDRDIHDKSSIREGTSKENEKNMQLGENTFNIHEEKSILAEVEEDDT